MVGLGTKKLQSILILLIGIVAILLVNILANRYFTRFDLTEEGRYTIKPATKKLLGELDDVVYVEVYLSGELNADFKRLQKAIRETLDEFRVYSGNNIQYVFNDPSQAMGQQAKNKFMQNLVNKGITPTNVFDNENGKRTEKIIFPGAIISYGGQEAGVMLLKGNKAATAMEKLNQSIEGLEYELASSIAKLTSVERKTIGLVKGHGELDSLNIISFKNELTEFYNVRDVYLSDQQTVNGVEALIIAKPTQPYSDLDKYKLDQYIMYGGNAIFLIDMLEANMDSVASEANFAFPYTINLEDQLFKYGVRVNNDLVQDRTSSAYPVVTGYLGEQPKVQMLSWPFFPLINHYSEHPVVRNLDAITTRFVNTVDTVKASGIKKTPIIFTSDYSRSVNAPVKVSVNDLRKNLNPDKFNRKNIPIGYLLEGKFTSLYKNRFAPEGAKLPTVERSDGSKIVVIGDGDLVRNEINPRSGLPFELGFDPFAKVTFANKDLMLNIVSYLVEEEGLITARSKEIKIRPLNKVKIEEERLFWQVINLGFPILLVMIYGMVRFYIRKKKFSTFYQP